MISIPIKLNRVLKIRMLWFFAYLLCVVVALEMTLRLYDIASGRIISSDMFAEINVSKKMKHPFLEYTARRSFVGEVYFIEPGQLFTLQTNSDGFRTHEFYPKRPEEYRVLILGDSFTFGYNANQNETYPSVLEQMLQEKISKNIHVYSLGISGYSTMKYAMLTRLYIDQLEPDMIIVAVDQSDFEEDLEYVNKYDLDDNGVPQFLKNVQEIDQWPDDAQMAIDQDRTLFVLYDSRLKARLLVGSSLARYTYYLFNNAKKNFFKIQSWLIEHRYIQNSNTISYEDLVDTYSYNLSKVLPKRLLVDTIPYGIETAKNRYLPTLRALRYIRDESKKRGIAMYISSYPWPWMVSTEEAIPYQIHAFGAIYDFRNNKVHIDLMDYFATLLGVDHVNVYPVFEKDSVGKYGKYDPHFNAQGYRLYAEVLFEFLKDKIKTIN